MLTPLLHDDTVRSASIVDHTQDHLRRSAVVGALITAVAIAGATWPALTIVPDEAHRDVPAFVCPLH